MAQNIYDDPSFFKSYNHLPRSQHGLSAAPEWPTLKSMILKDKPDIKGAHVLDLGCGYGWFCRWAVEEGLAGSTHGIDISEKMLERAREMTTPTPAGSISYQQADLDTVVLGKEAYEVVYSSLTFHYLRDLARLFGAVCGALKPKGRFVFSVEHPVYTAPMEDKWHRTEDGGESWLLHGYGDEGERVRHWLGEDVRKYHRTTQTYLSLLLRGGFTLVDLVEWMPSDTDLEEHPDWAVERNRPAFLLIAAEKVE
ncbi:class I SAM-dependent DNA methyltransferase [Aspergillus lucknowensis]|uniref:S-adenosyl-L-methionine-dependent methyltransferase n=1 Tax=Aspergillus lucknowensis TaxID=176173 RepID=A0ABR4LX29_9EURO